MELARNDDSVDKVQNKTDQQIIPVAPKKIQKSLDQPVLQPLLVDHKPPAIDSSAFVEIKLPTPEPKEEIAVVEKKMPILHSNNFKVHPETRISTTIYVRNMIKQQTKLTAKGNSDNFEHSLNF